MCEEDLMAKSDLYSDDGDQSENLDLLKDGKFDEYIEMLKQKNGNKELVEERRKFNEQMQQEKDFGGVFDDFEKELAEMREMNKESGIEINLEKEIDADQFKDKETTDNSNPDEVGVPLLVPETPAKSSSKQGPLDYQIEDKENNNT